MTAPPGQPAPSGASGRGTPEGMEAPATHVPAAPSDGQPLQPYEPYQTPVASQPAEQAAPGSARRSGRPGRRWLRWLKVAFLVVALPVAALLIGLLVAWIAHLIRGNGNPKIIQPVIQPSASAPATTPASAPVKAAPVVVPSDWVAEVAPPAGLTFSHPVGWIRRTSTPEVLRFAPAAAGSTAPGIEGVGAGVETATNPAQALTNFATRVYGAQPGYTAAAVAAVPATAAGAHPGEQLLVVEYLRSGVPVQVVLHSYRSGGKTVLVLGRSARAQAARAAQLEAYAEASVKLG